MFSALGIIHRASHTTPKPTPRHSLLSGVKCDVFFYYLNFNYSFYVIFLSLAGEENISICVHLISLILFSVRIHFKLRSQAGAVVE